MKSDYFNENQIAIVNDTLEIAEDLVSEYYKMSSTQWLRNRYEVKTLAELKKNEVIEKLNEPFAQIFKYGGAKKGSPLVSEAFDLYIICLTDTAILNFINERPEISLFSFLLYIQVHELIHIVRFGQFEQFFDAKSEAREVEEIRVHKVTQEILRKNSAEGLSAVIAYFSTAVA